MGNTAVRPATLRKKRGTDDILAIDPGHPDLSAEKKGKLVLCPELIELTEEAGGGPAEGNAPLFSRLPTMAFEVDPAGAADLHPFRDKLLSLLLEPAAARQRDRAPAVDHPMPGEPVRVR